jgi:hypothetical protein
MSTNLYNYTINGTKPPARTAAPSVMANVEFPVGILYNFGDTGGTNVANFYQ